MWTSVSPCFKVATVEAVTKIATVEEYTAYAVLLGALCVLAGLGALWLWIIDRDKKLRLLEAAMSKEAGE